MQFSLKNTKIQKPIFYHSNIIFNQFWEFFFFRISHLFYNFTPFFRTLFNFFLVTALLLAYTDPLKKKVSPYLSRFSNFACYKFLWHHTHGRTHGRTDAQTNFWITIPWVGLKALKLKHVTFPHIKISLRKQKNCKFQHIKIPFPWYYTRVHTESQNRIPLTFSEKHTISPDFWA